MYGTGRFAVIGGDQQRMFRDVVMSSFKALTFTLG